MRALKLLIVGAVIAVWFIDISPTAPAERIVFDTDSGPFNDDGAALVMAARSPQRIVIEGVTLVPGNVWPAEGAGYTSRILKLLNRPELRLYFGAREPLVNSRALADVFAKRWGRIEYTGAFARPVAAARGDEPPSRSAIDLLIETVDRNPGQITLLALGPMTNIAIALRLRPDIQTKIKRLVFMGGNVRVPGNSTRAAEFNFWFDPEAAQIVLRSKIPRKVMFGLDICNRAVLTRARFEEVIATKTPITELFKEDYGNTYPGFFQHPDAVGYLWDELAAAYLIDPSFVTASESMYLDVETRFGERYGAVIPLDRSLAPEATPVEVMLNLDFPRVFRMYKELLTRR